jgi:hypothetical protein
MQHIVPIQNTSIYFSRMAKTTLFSRKSTTTTMTAEHIGELWQGGSDQKWRVTRGLGEWNKPNPNLTRDKYDFLSLPGQGQR